MRILHVTNAYLPVTNGVTSAVSGWVDGLRADGHDAVVWTVGDERLATEGVVCSPRLLRLVDGYYLPASLAVPDTIRDGQWDVVHVHHPTLLGPVAQRFAHSQGIPCVATVHSDYVGYVVSYAKPIAPFARAIVTARVRDHFGRADLVLTPSASAASGLRSLGVRTRTLECSYPAMPAGFKPASRKKARFSLGVRQGQPIALYAGRLAREKRLDELVDEFEETVRWVPRATLVIAGDGPMRHRVERHAARLPGVVRYVGRLSRDELNLWYAAADVVVSASRQEVGPLTVIEAARCGTAAVARDVSAFPERIRHRMSGLLCAEGEGDLGRAMALPLLDRSFAHAMGETAAKMNARHTVQGSARMLAETYEQLRGRRESARFAPVVTALRRLQ